MRRHRAVHGHRLRDRPGRLDRRRSRCAARLRRPAADGHLPQHRPARRRRPRPPRETALSPNPALRGGAPPPRRYIPELLGDVLAGRINPSLVFDYETGLDDVKDAYDAMIDRRATKSLVRMSG